MKKALTNYYARLIKKGVYKLEDVPEDGREEVQEAMNKLPDDFGDQQHSSSLKEDESEK